MSEIDNQNGLNPDGQTEQNNQPAAEQNSCPDCCVNGEHDTPAEEQKSCCCCGGSDEHKENAETRENAEQKCCCSSENEHSCCCGSNENEQNHEEEQKCSCGCCGGDGKKCGKKGWIIGLCIAAVLAIIAFFAYDPILLRVNPTEYLIKASLNTTKQAVANMPEWVKAFAKSSQDGNISLKIDTTELAKQDDEFKDTSIAVNAQIKANAADSSSSFTVDGSVNDTAFDISYINDGSTISVSSDKFTDGTAYGIALDTFEQKFADSVFAPDSGSNFSLDQQTYDLILNSAKNGTSSKFDFNEYMNKSAELTRKALGEIKPEISKQTITLGQKDVKATAIKYSLDGEQTKALMQASIDMFNDMGLFNLYSAEQLKTVEQAYKDITMTYYIKGGNIVKEYIIATLNGESMGTDDTQLTADINFGLNPFKNGEFDFKIDTADLYTDQTSTVAYSAKNEDGKYVGNMIMTSSDLASDENENGSMAMTLSFDRENGEFSITVAPVNEENADGEQSVSENFVIFGKVEKTDSGYIVSITGIDVSADDQTQTYPISILLSSGADNQIEKRENITNILDMSEDALYSVFYGIVFNIYSASSAGVAA